MNDLKTGSNRGGTKTFALSVIALSLFASLTAMADQAGDASRTNRVQVTDLDLSSSKGQQVALQRVQRMARTICTQLIDPLDMSHHTNYVACVDSTVAQAVVRIQAMVSLKTQASLAQNDIKTN